MFLSPGISQYQNYIKIIGATCISDVVFCFIKVSNFSICTSDFRMRDSAEVEKILVAAGKGSYSESMYEAGPQSVTQVPHSSSY